MLFNAPIFIFVFLPVCLFGFYALGRWQLMWSLAWLVVCSLFFYAWWNPIYLVLMLASIGLNYQFGRHLAKRPRKWLLVCGISVNVGLLAYFKYANFFVETLQSAGAQWHLDPILLPLAISFFTFQQIAYLVDAYRQETQEYHFLQYCLFVTFFPQLIAGPIVHHKEMAPQFMQQKNGVCWENIAIGVSIFTMGLFKKVILADGVAEYSTPVFDAAASGVAITFFEAWAGALAYTLQLYFDFSGYSDMAIGLARLFGIVLPLNFYSPYKASNIIEFWRRWHVTLSRFLRDYLYIPLGGNRFGRWRRYRNLLLTMLLGGLWHGAGWTFLLWGGLHGVYLVINHAWRALTKRLPWSFGLFGRVCATVTTFLAIVVAWVVFRADNIDVALNILTGMLGGHGVLVSPGVAPALPASLEMLGLSVHVNELATRTVDDKAIKWIVGCLLLVWFAPNTLQLMQHYRPALNLAQIQSRPTALRVVFNAWWVAACAIVFTYCVLHLSRVSEFLYFQF